MKLNQIQGNAGMWIQTI